MPDGPASALELELALDPDDGARLLRRFGRRRERGGGKLVSMAWHDTSDGELEALGLALVERRQSRATSWSLERVWPDPAETWPCGTPAPVLAEGPDRSALGQPLPAPLLALAQFRGRRRQLPAADPAAPAATLLKGTLRTKAGTQPVTRLTLSGEPRAVAGLALDLAREMRLSVPRRSLSAEAWALAGKQASPESLGAPELPPGLPVGGAFAFVVAHLGRVILHYAPLAAAREGTEPVHQMRVAVRRLRSALALFRRAVACADIDAARTGLRVLGQALGPARDWDVFTTGTGQAVAASFPDDAAVGRLIAAADRRREACYDELRRVLDGAEFRCLGITLAILAAVRPWEAEIADPAGEGATRRAEALSAGLHAYAAHVLSRRLRRLTEYDEDITALPDETLHAIRLGAKRLRYGVEIFAPLYPRREARRYLRRLIGLQDRLGLLNDGAVAAALMAELGRTGGRSYSAGVVCGFVAARASDARAEIERAWRKFRRLQPPWA